MAPFNKPIQSGTKGLVVYNKKLLLILRDDKPGIPFPNTWEYIGGGKDNGESFEEAGLREIKEELGIRPKNYTFLGLDRYENRQAGRFIVFLAKDEYKKINLGNEGVKFDWFALDEVVKLKMAPNLKKFLLDNLAVLAEVIEKGHQIDPKKFVFTDENTPK
jgi:8-oxo-dGTP diphosphatase